MSRPKVISASLTCAAALLLTLGSPSIAVAWTTTRLGAGSGPSVSGPRVVWAGPSTFGSPSHVYMWLAGDAAPEEISFAHGIYPCISGDRVVWQGWSGEDGVHTWSVGESAPMALGTSAGVNGAVSGNRVVWLDASQVYTWTLGDSGPATVGSGPVIYPPHVSGDRIVWVSQTDGQVYTWVPGAAAPVNVSESGQTCSEARVSGDRIVWVQVVRTEQTGPDDVQVFTDIFTRALGDPEPTNVTNTDAVVDGEPQVDGDRLAWRTGEAEDAEIVTWAAGDATPTNVSNRSGLYDVSPAVSGDRVVWRGWDGNDDEVFTWHVGDTGATNISNRDGLWDDCAGVSGDRVVWQGFDGTSWQVYTAVEGETQVADILRFFDASVQSGALTGIGADGRSAVRVALLRDMLASAGTRIDSKSWREARATLLAACARCDGRPTPPDYVVGTARGQLAAMVASLLESLGNRRPPTIGHRVRRR
jgi:hypothetical protein